VSDTAAMSDPGRLVASDTEQRVAELARRREIALAGGGVARVERHKASGRLTARERIDLLIDGGSWYELGLLAEPELRREEPAAADAVITGFGTIGRREVAVIAIDPTVLAGTTAPVNMRKQNRIARWAGRRGIPLICLSDNDGGRIPDVMGWRFSGLPFDFNTFSQAPPGCPEIPRLIAVLGPAFGDSALQASMGHYVVMTRSASMALVGPPVVAAAIGEKLTAAELGGPSMSADSGYAHAVADDERAAIDGLKRAFSYFPDSGALPAPGAAPVGPARAADQLLRLVPTDSRRGYDMRKVLEAIFDGSSILPWKERFGASLLCCLARLNGEVVGVIASQPMRRAGVLDSDAMQKEVEFARLCDTFNFPIVFLQDVPGLMVGSEAERSGILHAYEKTVGTLARVRVPKIAVLVRKAYGGGHFALGGRPTHPDLILAWPTAELGFMTPTTGVQVVHKRLLEQTLATDGEEAHAGLVERLGQEWAHESEPWEAAKHVYIDDVIDPRETREQVARGIRLSWGSGIRVASLRHY
jgi:acetyl-CoA carboxylase carboxyltransferase component